MEKLENMKWNSWIESANRLWGTLLAMHYAAYLLFDVDSGGFDGGGGANFMPPGGGGNALGAPVRVRRVDSEPSFF